MPSSAELPSLPELLRAFHASVGSEQKTEDAHLGSFYDRMAGVGALCMRTLAERDQGEARAIFFDAATDDRLDEYVEGRGGDPRTLDTPGAGTIALARASATAGADTILKGSRFSVVRPGDTARYWVATADIPVSSTALAALVPIEATVPGPAGRISIGSGQGAGLSIVDRSSDASWQIARIDCGPGTTRQRDAEFRATLRQGRKDTRPGYPTAIIKAMTDAGASVVALYQSDYLGDAADFGLNRIFVGDSGYQSPAALLTACRLAVPRCAVAGTATQVLPMATTSITVSATVQLWKAPDRLNQVQAQADAAAAILGYFASRDNAFLWSAAAIRAAIMKVVKGVHNITVSASSGEPDPAVMFNTSPLPRYVLSDAGVTVAVTGPS